MTQYRKDLDAISNHFDELFNGVGHRGSSFMDIDGLIHDGHTRRFLMLEFKHRDEALSSAQEWALTDFARLHGHFAMAIWWMAEDEYKVRYYPDKIDDVVCGRVLRGIIKDWWNICA